MDFDKLFPGRFLKAGLLGGKDVTLAIRAVRVEQMDKDGGGKEPKAIVSFDRTPMELVLNKTNGLCLREMWGRETDAWIGKRVTLFAAELNGEPCIRVRGSPDIERDITFELKLPRKAGKRTRLIKTGAGASAAQETETEPEPQP